MAASSNRLELSLRVVLAVALREGRDDVEAADAHQRGEESHDDLGEVGAEDLDEGDLGDLLGLFDLFEDGGLLHAPPDEVGHDQQRDREQEGDSPAPP
ncbi:MAG: hypothetical protein LKI24_09755 [Acidipropionibacterium sp.]|jgi:hypothetical protein|nr:hypothetical protein [Acidipropionibacterium sp.]